MKKLFFVSVLIMAVQFTPLAYAQDRMEESMTMTPSPGISLSPSSPEVTTEPQVQSVQTTEIKGEVLQKDGNTLTIKTDEGTKQVTIPSTSNVTRNTLGAKLDDIKPNDSITVTQSADGQVLSLSATGGDVQDFGKWAIPAAVLALLVIGGALYLMSKANKSHIKTTVG